MMEDGTALGAKHYQQEGDQPIEIMQNKMSVEQFIGFLRGNVIKYACRMGCKGEPLKDAQKAAQYATWLVQALKGDKINPNEGKNIKIKPEWFTWGEKSPVWDKICERLKNKYGAGCGIGCGNLFVRGEQTNKGDIIVDYGGDDIELVKRIDKKCTTCQYCSENNLVCMHCSLSSGYQCWSSGYQCWEPKEKQND